MPPNLYLIGTVNMDETTHAFSPKVLDRAFTIELSEVDFATYQIAGTSTSTEMSAEAKRDLLDAFTRYDATTGQRRFARISKPEIAAIVAAEPLIRTRLDALNRELQRHRFHFGYRVFDEIGQYLFNNRENGMMPFEEAFDHAVRMKVLPKFNGSRASLRAPLLTLLTWILYPDAPSTALSGVQQAFAALDLDNVDQIAAFTQHAVFRATAERAMQMLHTLETEGFVAFG